jgi:hypothetical protein
VLSDRSPEHSPTDKDGISNQPELKQLDTDAEFRFEVTEGFLSSSHNTETIKASKPYAGEQISVSTIIVADLTIVKQ